jgi:hypothetical protein
MSTPTSIPSSHTTSQHLIAHTAEYMLFGVLIVGALVMFLTISIIAVRRAVRRQ